MRIRYVSFNVDALKRVATIAAGAGRCVEMVKTAEGNVFHVVSDFITSLDRFF